MPNKFVGHGPYHYAEGGHIRKELKFMADKGAPESMIKAEKKEHGLPFGKKKYDDGGVVEGQNRKIDDDTRERARAAVTARLAAAEAGASEPNGIEVLPDIRKNRQAAKAVGSSMKRNSFPLDGERGIELLPDTRKNRSAAKAVSADMRGNSSRNFAKGGSIDGCAARGKTRGKVL